MTHFTKPLFAVTLPLCLLASAASGQDTPVETEPTATGEVQTAFDAAYFEVYAPRTALDMIGQIPGFSITTGDTSRRGLGQGGANVLVNGERITGKADVFDQLDQILSSNVTLIRVLDGASLSIPGLSGRVVDITTRTSAFNGSWEWYPEFREGLRPRWLDGRINISGERGDLAWSGFFRNNSNRGGALGTEVRSDPDGTPFETRELDIDNYFDAPSVGGTLAWTPAPGHKANLNTEFIMPNFNRDVNGVRTRLAEGGEDRLTRFEFAEDEVYWELGADYERPAFGGTIKAIGYIELESSPTKATLALFDPDTGFDSASQFIQDADESEYIARAEYTREPTPGRSWQFGVEGAFNALDITQQGLSQTGGDGRLYDGNGFAGDDPDRFSVAEDRYEATVTHSRPIGSKWDLQASAGVELSELSQMQDGAAESDAQSFVRPKGFVAATYKIDPSTRIRSRVEREVGQLNFFDFVASVDLDDDLGRDANPDLVPAQSWLGSVEFDKDFGQGNTLKIEGYVALIEDIVDRIPIGVDGDAVGNLDSARRWGVDIEGTLKGERWNLPGLRLDAELEWRDSSVEDPLTGRTRPLSGDKEVYYEVSFRHDIPGTDIAYGGFAERYISRRRFSSFTIDRSGETKPLTGLYIEHKDILGIKARVQFVNLSNAVEFGERTVFDGRRDGDTILRRERAEYDFGPILQFRFSGEF